MKTKLKLLGFEFWEKKKKKNENENEVERVTAASWLLFFPDFLPAPKYIKPFVTNQQIINIQLEYKYFVSCWQRNFVSYCLLCDCGIITPQKNLALKI